MEDQSQYFESTKVDVRATASRFEWGAKVACGASALAALSAVVYMGAVPDWEG